MAKSIVIGNQKGGVGKSTCSILIAVMLGQGGIDKKSKKQRVLVVDLDSQRNLSLFFLGFLGMGINRNNTLPVNPNCEEGLAYNMADVISGEPFIPYETEYENVHILPNAGNIDDLRGQLSGDKVGKQNVIDALTEILRTFLDIINDEYDVVIFDTPPSLTFPQLASFNVSDYGLLVTKLEHFSTQSGIPSTLDTIEDMNFGKRNNNPLKLLGILINEVKVKNYETGKMELTQQANLDFLYEHYEKHLNPLLMLSSNKAYEIKEIPDTNTFFQFMKNQTCVEQLDVIHKHVLKTINKGRK